MTPYRIFAGVTAGASALILVLTQVVGDGRAERVGPPRIEPIPLPTVAPSSATSVPPVEESTEPTSPPIGTVIYEHDFSSPENGVLAGQSSDTASNEFGNRLAEYTDRGTILVRSTSELPTYVAGANTEGMVVAGRDLAGLGEVSIEADATPVDIGVGASWGLACRRDREVGRFYFAFLGDAGGHAGAGIIRQDEPGGPWAEIASRPLPASLTIGEGLTNRLRLDCTGSTITLFVDGRKVLEGEDFSYEAGSIALFVSPLAAGSEASAEVEFDNLVIRES